MAGCLSVWYHREKTQFLIGAFINAIMYNIKFCPLIWLPNGPLYTNYLVEPDHKDFLSDLVSTNQMPAKSSTYHGCYQEPKCWFDNE